MRRLAVLPALVVLLCSGPVRGVDQQETDVPDKTFAIQGVHGLHSTLGVPAFFGRALGGQFNAGVTPDFVYLHETTPVLVLNPNLVQTAWKFLLAVGETVSDIARLTRFVSTEGDPIITAGSGGLKSWQIAAGALVPNVISTDSRWDGAHSLGVIDLDGDGNEDLYGIDANGDVVVVSNVAGAATTMTIVPPAGENFIAVAAVADSYNPGYGQLVTIGGNSMRLYNHLGVNTLTNAITNPEAIAVVTEEGDGDRIAIVFRPTALQWLVVLDDTNNASTMPVSLGVSNVTAMSAARVTLSDPAGPDGEDLTDDLIMIVGNNSDVVVLENAGDGVFDPSTPEIYNTQDDTGTENFAIPAAADFDSDGDVDLVYGDRGLGGLLMLRGSSTVSYDLTPDLADLFWVQSREEDSPGVYLTKFTADVVPPARWSGMNDPGIELQIRLFEGPHRTDHYDPVSDNWYSPTQEIMASRADLPDLDNAGVPLSALTLETSESEDEGTYPLTLDHVYFFYVRYVVKSQGVVDRVYPARAIGLTTDCAGDEFVQDYLHQLREIGQVDYDVDQIDRAGIIRDVPTDWYQNFAHVSLGQWTVMIQGVCPGTGVGLEDPVPDLPEDLPPEE